MATRTPPLQDRSRVHAFWGVYANADSLPNASKTPLPAAAFVLEAGDTAYADGTLFVCTGAGKPGGGNATWSSLGGGGATPLWAWNGVDTTQFDPVPVASVGQSVALSVLPADLSQNRPTPVLNAATTWAGAGGALVVRLTDPPTLPARFRVVMGLTQVESNGTRGGPFFFNGASWGAGLLGGGTTFGANATRQVIARPAAPYPPFDVPITTPAFASVASVESRGGLIAQMRVAKLDGGGGAPPAMIARLSSEGSDVIGDAVESYTLDRGSFFGTGAAGSTPNVAFTGIAIDAFGLLFQSVNVGTFNMKFDRIEIWAD